MLYHYSMNMNTIPFSMYANYFCKPSMSLSVTSQIVSSKAYDCKPVLSYIAPTTNCPKHIIRTRNKVDINENVSLLSSVDYIKSSRKIKHNVSTCLCSAQDDLHLSRHRDLDEHMACVECLEPVSNHRHESPPSSLDIVRFLEDKNIFITGATGFLAKGMNASPS